MLEVSMVAVSIDARSLQRSTRRSAVPGIRDWSVRKREGPAWPAMEVGERWVPGKAILLQAILLQAILLKS